MTAISSLSKYLAFSKSNWPNSKKSVKIFLGLIMCMVILALMDSYYSFIIWSGYCAAFFGIITGSIGIRLSYVNRVTQMKCLWIAFIFLVSQFRLYKIIIRFKSILTIFSALAGCGTCVTAAVYAIKYDCDYCYNENFIPGLLAAEAFLSIGKGFCLTNQRFGYSESIGTYVILRNLALDKL